MVAKPKKPRPRPVYFETTIPVFRPCQRCAVWLAAGVAEGVKAQAELAPVDTGQALWCVAMGIELYCMTRTGLVHMDSIRLAGPSFGRLYPQHRCDIRWPVPTGPRFTPPARPDIPPY